MDKAKGFYTLKGYQIMETAVLTTAMEDYLEMICRLAGDAHTVRVNELSRMLHVRPSSVSKMLQQLDAAGFLNAEKYGMITLTEQGRAAGRYLLYRHRVVHDFLCWLNHSESELEQAEKIEHFFTPKTVANLERLTAQNQKK